MSAELRKKLNLSHLTEEECERILQVIQRDFELRQNEKHRLSKIEEEIQQEDKKVEILAKQKNFNDNCCMRCFSRFFFIFNQKLQCQRCQYFICKSCSQYVAEDKAYCCNVCLRQLELEKESLDWFYTNVKRKFKRFGSAKVVRSLYKRKTDSDSENDSGYDPSLYSHSLPIGKRPRHSIEELLTATAPAALVDSDEESPISASTHSPTSASQQNSPYTCTVPSTDAYNRLARDEIETFKVQLNDVVNQVHETLAEHTDASIANGNSPQQYEHLLDNHRLRLSERLSNLSHNLVLAIDNNDISSALPSPGGRQQYVKILLTQEVEKFVNSTIDLGDETTSEYASEDGSTCEYSGRTYEDILADAILKKIVDDYMKYEDEYHQQQEDKVRRELTKLSNQCTVYQLQEVLTTDSDDQSSHQVSQDINDSDLSDIQEEVALESEAVCQSEAPAQDFDDRSQRERSDSDLDDLVQLNEQYSTQLEDSMTVSATSTPLAVRKAANNDLKVSTESPTVRTELATPEISILRETQLSASESFQTEALDGSKEPESDLDLDLDPERSLDTDEDRVTSEFDNSDDEKSLMDFVTRRSGVALPSFGDENGDLDLDDISHTDGDTTMDSEFVFGDSWAAPSPHGVFGWSRISAYDNYGDKKVGNDQSGPVYMLIPEHSSAPRVGDRDVDELTDGTLTDEELEDHEDLNLAFIRHMITGEALPNENDTPATEATEVIDVTQADIASRLNSDILDDLEDDLEPDPEDSDPRFVVKPGSQEAEEGEMVSFTCQVQGSIHTDVFWYHDMVEVTQIEDNDHYELSDNNGRYTMDVYNVTPDHQGAYLCIAVNDNGQSHHSFKLRVKENLGEKSPPKFLKSPQDQEVVEGSTVVLRCKLSGYPTPRVIWYKDGRRLRNSGHFIMEKQGNRDYTLTIHAATLDDDAEYSITARNMCGEAKCCAQLMVEPKPVVLSPTGGTAPSLGLSDKRSSALYPDADELLRIAEEVHAQRNSVEGTANNLLQSAENKSAAEGVRKATTRALELLVEIEDSNQEGSKVNQQGQGPSEEDLWLSLESKSDRETRSADHETRSAGQETRSVGQATRTVLRQEVVQSETLESSRELENFTPGASEKDEKGEVDLDLSFQDCEKLYRLGMITREQIRRGRVNQSERPKLVEALQIDEPVSPDETDDLDTINCGLKRIPSKRYKRDYVINRSPVAQRRKWEVQKLIPSTEVVKATPAGFREQVSLDSMEDEIYMASGKVYTLEERIQQLERSISSAGEESELDRLEDEVAKMVAQTHQSEAKVAEIENSVEYLKQQMPSHDQGHMTDHMTSASQSESRIHETPVRDTYDVKELEEDVEMPSVKSLRSMFNQDFRNPDGSAKRVYSLTGRDIPRTVREKLKRQTPSVVTQVNYDSRSEPKRRAGVLELFGDSELRVSEDRSHDHSSGQSDSSSSTVTSPGVKEHTQYSSSTPEGTGKRTGSILARAAFWDKRVTLEQQSDIDVQDTFPAMMDHQRKITQEKSIPLEVKEFDHEEV